MLITHKVGAQFEQTDSSRDDVVESFENLIDAIEDSTVLNLMNNFEKQFDTLSGAYMTMVEILLLEFVRAERNGSWYFHSQAFEAMLPWLTIYDQSSYSRCSLVNLADMKALSATTPEVYTEFVAANCH